MHTGADEPTSCALTYPVPGRGTLGFFGAVLLYTVQRFGLAFAGARPEALHRSFCPEANVGSTVAPQAARAGRDAALIGLDVIFAMQQCRSEAAIDATSPESRLLDQLISRFSWFRSATGVILPDLFLVV